MPYDDYANYRGPYDDHSHINGMDYNTDTHSSSNQTPPYPSQYGPDRINMPQPQMMPSNTSSPSGQRPETYHGSSEGNPWYQQPQMMPPNTSSPSSQRPEMRHGGGDDGNTWYQQPHAHTGRINDAVNSAFSDADRPSYLSPEVLSQITANVIQQLKTTGLDNIQGGQQQPQPQPQQPQQQWHSQWSPSASGPGFNHSQSPTSPRAGHEGTSNYQPSPVPPVEYQSSSRSASRASPDSQTMERHGSRASQGSEPSSKVESRPSHLSREATDPDLTTLEKIWGRLFEGGKPTKRLGQFLRGVAVHLVCAVLTYLKERVGG